MTLVKELIEFSSWERPQGFDLLKPEFSILLPTFKRGDSGLFQACLDSLVGQTFQNFECIIIDDASTDSTRSIIEEYMAQDVRIATIRHNTNIGLPAISIFEGYQKARSNKIFFAFDDNEYKTWTLEKIHDFFLKTPGALVTYIGAEQPVSSDETHYLGIDDFNYDFLRAKNNIPNGGLTIDKEVIEAIGWYDPHICVARLCDWDLIRRIGKIYKIHKINSILAVEKGVTQTDSLGSSYHIDLPLALEWLNIDRNELLLPKNFLNYNLSWIPEILSDYSKVKVYDFLYKTTIKRGNHLKLDTINYFQNELSGYILVFNEFDASTELCFDNIPSKWRQKIIILSSLDYLLTGYPSVFLNARAVILSRSIIEDYFIAVEFLKLLGIPYYYYSDDNFFVLEKLSPEKKKKNSNFINSAKSVLVSTEALASFFIENKIHDSVRVLNPIVSQEQIGTRNRELNHYKNSKELNLIFGSVDRVDWYYKFSDNIGILADKYKVTLNIFVSDEKIKAKYREIFNDKAITLVFHDLEYCHNVYVNEVKKIKAHFFIHPMSLNKVYQKNYSYKTMNMLINGYLTSSLIILPNTVPYSFLAKEKNLGQLLFNSSDDIPLIIDTIMSNPLLAEELLDEQEAYCSTHFGYEKNVSIIEEIFANTPVVDIRLFNERVQKLSWSHNKCAYYDRKKKYTTLQFIKKVMKKLLPKSFYNALKSIYHHVLK